MADSPCDSHARRLAIRNQALNRNRQILSALMGLPAHTPSVRIGIPAPNRNPPRAFLCIMAATRSARRDSRGRTAITANDQRMTEGRGI